MAEKNIVLSPRVGSGVRTGVRASSILAMIVSIVVNKSAGWALLHGIFGIFYLFYAFLVGDFAVFNEELRAVFSNTSCEVTVTASSPASVETSSGVDGVDGVDGVATSSDSSAVLLEE